MTRVISLTFCSEAHISTSNWTSLRCTPSHLKYAAFWRKEGTALWVRPTFFSVRQCTSHSWWLNCQFCHLQCIQSTRWDFPRKKFVHQAIWAGLFVLAFIFRFAWTLHTRKFCVISSQTKQTSSEVTVSESKSILCQFKLCPTHIDSSTCPHSNLLANNNKDNIVIARIWRRDRLTYCVKVEDSWKQMNTCLKCYMCTAKHSAPSRLHQPIIGLTAARSLLIGRNAATPVAAFHAFPEGLTHGRILLALHLKSRIMTMCLALELESWVVVIFYRCLFHWWCKLSSPTSSTSPHSSVESKPSYLRLIFQDAGRELHRRNLSHVTKVSLHLVSCYPAPPVPPAQCKCWVRVFACVWQRAGPRAMGILWPAKLFVAIPS